MAKPTAVAKSKAAPPKSSQAKGKKAADEVVEIIDDDPSSDIEPSKRRQSLNLVKNKHWTHTLAYGGPDVHLIGRKIYRRFRTYRPKDT